MHGAYLTPIRNRIFAPVIALVPTHACAHAHAHAHAHTHTHTHTHREHFPGQEIRNAVYAHAWDASRSRLFACGGPLAFGLKGCYMAIWE
jgi:hypothetical protein